MTIIEAQQRFAVMVGKLLMQADAMGYGVTLGEAYRPPELAALYARQGRGIANSLHTQRLAVDLHLFRDGKFLSTTEAHAPLGEWWESIGGAWGGRFNDGGHYSLTYGGRK